MSVVLPLPYPAHKHATEEMREIAHKGLILLAEVGSGVHGIALGSVNDDVDLMGLTVEPPEYVTGLQRFDQFERHTAWDRQGGMAERSGSGDTDYLIYGIRKFCSLALDGNPSILNLLFIPDSAVQFDTGHAQRLRGNASWFVSTRAADRYLGYLHRQRLGITGEAGAKVNRPELVDQHGFDVKYASHALRLGFQGIELMRTGRITLPMPVQQREMVLQVKRGEVSLDRTLVWILTVEEQLREAAYASSLPDHPDRASVNAWLRRTYLTMWGSDARSV